MKPTIERLQDVFDELDGVRWDAYLAADYRTAEHIHGEELKDLEPNDVVLELYNEKFEEGNETPFISFTLADLLNAEIGEDGVMLHAGGDLEFVKFTSFKLS